MISTQHDIKDEMSKDGFTLPDDWKGGGNPWVNGHIRYCMDPNVSDGARNGFLLAVKQYEKALPGCLEWEPIDYDAADGGKCKGYPEVPSVFVTSKDEGCFATDVGAWGFS